MCTLMIEDNCTTRTHVRMNLDAKSNTVFKFLKIVLFFRKLLQRVWQNACNRISDIRRIIACVYFHVNILFRVG